VIEYIREKSLEKDLHSARTVVENVIHYVRSMFGAFRTRHWQIGRGGTELDSDVMASMLRVAAMIYDLQFDLIASPVRRFPLPRAPALMRRTEAVNRLKRLIADART
jgi:hypothetical protein